MNNAEYQAAALRTESLPETIKTGEIPLHALLCASIAVTQIANEFKRAIFYSKDFDNEKIAEMSQAASGLLAFISHAAANGDLEKSVLEMKMENKVTLPVEFDRLDKSNIDIRLLHAGIGIFTEAGEVLEHIFKAYEDGMPVDLVAFGEELADIDWYQAIGSDAIGIDMDSLRVANIAKLKARFPEKFDADLAINRDTDNERAVLDSHHVIDMAPRGSLGEVIEA